MNTKMMPLVSTLTLILAGSASAQMIAILPGGRGNLHIGTPTTLPGPMSNISIKPRINLPSPLLTPSMTLTLAPVPMAATIPVLPVSLPAAIAAIRITVERENVAMPHALRARFAAPATDAVVSHDRLEDLFDGRKQPNSDDLSPVRPDHHHSLPENDLEKEIGAY